MPPKPKPGKLERLDPASLRQIIAMSSESPVVFAGWLERSGSPALRLLKLMAEELLRRPQETSHD